MRFRAFTNFARVLAIGLPCVLCPAASAQEEGRFLVQAGFAVADLERGERSPGIELMLGYGPGGPWWLVGEAAIQFGSSSGYRVGERELNHGMFFLAAGPQLAYVGERIRVYGHALFSFASLGYPHPGSGPDTLAVGARALSRGRGGDGRVARPAGVAGYAGGGVPSLVSVGGFGFALGVGLDVFVSERSAIRIFQVEYLPSLLRNVPEYRPPGVPAPVVPSGQAAVVDEILRDHEGWSHPIRVSVGYVYTARP